MLVAFVISNPVKAEIPPTVLVIGDSLSAAYGMDMEQGWVHLLSEKLSDQSPGATVINASISGTEARITIDKGEKVKIDQIVFHGAEAMDAEILARKMKDTKERRWWRFYKASKYLENSFNADLDKVVDHYHA